MDIDDVYAREEQMIIDDETLTEEERKRALRDLYWEAIEVSQMCCCGRTDK